MSAAELKGHLVGKKHLNKVFKAKKQQYINQEGILVSGNLYSDICIQIN